LGAALARTLAHFWPDYRSWLAEVKDTRDQEKITYGRAFLLGMGLMVFLLKLGSRRQVRFELDSPEALANLNRLILQLMERGSLLTTDARRLFGSLRNLARRLAKSLRNRLIPPDALDPAAARGIQIRLDTS
jgi:hypothetical protein